MGCEHLIPCVVADALNVLVRTELKIDAVGIVNRALRLVRPDQRGQISAHLEGERELTVGKRARAGKARGNMAIWFAIDAATGDGLRAAALFHREAFFYNHNPLFASALDHLECGEDAGRASANDHNVCLHVCSS